MADLTPEQMKTLEKAKVALDRANSILVDTMRNIVGPKGILAVTVSALVYVDEGDISPLIMAFGVNEAMTKFSTQVIIDMVQGRFQVSAEDLTVVPLGEKN